MKQSFNCLRCNFFYDPNEERISSYQHGGYCRRYPPQIIIIEKGYTEIHIECQWPHVECHWHCGEFKEKDIKNTDIIDSDQAPTA